jgi:hypothetical protein
MFKNKEKREKMAGKMKSCAHCGSAAHMTLEHGAEGHEWKVGKHGAGHMSYLGKRGKKSLNKAKGETREHENQLEGKNETNPE